MDAPRARLHRAVAVQPRVALEDYASPESFIACHGTTWTPRSSTEAVRREA